MPSGRPQYSSPFAGLVDIVHDMGRMRAAMHGEQSTYARMSGVRSHVDAWIPALDIAATHDRLVIYANMAGVADEDISVTFSPPTLTIAGQRRLPAPDEGGNDLTYHTQELDRGHFRRSITLPDGSTRDNITMALDRGLLTITVQHPAQNDMSRIPLTSDVSPQP